MNPVILIVLDGYGIAPAGPGNAITQANPVNMTTYMHAFPHTQLKASGSAVGLPAGEVGNTEVGHLNLGAGHIIYQDLLRINLSIADGSFYKNIAFLESLLHLSKTKGKLHLIGLVSDGAVHAHMDHLYALLFLCKQREFSRVFIHAFTDGRDSPPRMAGAYLSNLQDRLDKFGFGQIASVMGRYYAMDRDQRWERTEKAYRCLTQGVGQKASSWSEVLDQSYKKNITDEFIEPVFIHKDGKPLALIEQGDVVIFFNFRIDRPRQLTKAFVLDDFSSFARGPKIANLYFITMTEYERNLPSVTAFPPHIVSVCLGRILAENSINQLRMAESEKERFVTYYFNGMRETPFPYEDRIIIPSKKVATYDTVPAMSAHEITEALVKQIMLVKYKFILVNFANADMIGHTGNFSAALAAIAALDRCIGIIVSTALQYNYAVMITADHGNIEEMIDLKTGGVSTEHSANPVPLIIINNAFKNKVMYLYEGILADVAPTVLSLMGLTKPSDMTGRDLLKGKT